MKKNTNPTETRSVPRLTLQQKLILCDAAKGDGSYQCVSREHQVGYNLYQKGLGSMWHGVFEINDAGRVAVGLPPANDSEQRRRGKEAVVQRLVKRLMARRAGVEDRRRGFRLRGMKDAARNAYWRAAGVNDAIVELKAFEREAARNQRYDC